MLRKRTRSVQKDQQMGHPSMSDSGSQSSYFQSDTLGHSHKATTTSSFFSVPGLFLGTLGPKGSSDCDSVRSPTSPLDFMVFSYLGNPARTRTRKPSNNGNQKSFDCSKVGLSIVDSLAADDKGSSNVFLRSSDSKNILFGPQVRTRTTNLQSCNDSFEAPKSLPRNFAMFPQTFTKSPLKGNSDVLFEIGEATSDPEPFGKILSCSFDSCSSFSTLSRMASRNSKRSSEFSQLDNVAAQVNSPLQSFGGNPDPNDLSETNLTSTPMIIVSSSERIGSLSASEIEMSEDYTCVISHGPNPTKTHIYGDCILDAEDWSKARKNDQKEKHIGMPQPVTGSTNSSPFPPSDFLSICYYCNKKLEEGKDIYIYGGEKAFCSLNCRSQEIMMDEELEKAADESSGTSPKSGNGRELSEICIFDAP